MEVNIILAKKTSKSIAQVIGLYISNIGINYRSYTYDNVPRTTANDVNIDIYDSGIGLYFLDNCTFVGFSNEQAEMLLDSDYPWKSIEKFFSEDREGEIIADVLREYL